MWRARPTLRIMSMRCRCTCAFGVGRPPASRKYLSKPNASEACRESVLGSTTLDAESNLASAGPKHLMCASCGPREWRQQPATVVRHARARCVALLRANHGGGGQDQTQTGNISSPADFGATEVGVSRPSPAPPDTTTCGHVQNPALSQQTHLCYSEHKGNAGVWPTSMKQRLEWRGLQASGMLRRLGLTPDGCQKAADQERG